MTAHKHAALMMQYAQDAAETDAPWRRWEVLTSSGGWSQAVRSIDFSEFYEYRRKPQMVTRTITYPEPCREPLQFQQEFWVVFLDISAADQQYACRRIWTGAVHELNWLAQGRIHLNRENAEAHRAALLGGGDECI